MALLINDKCINCDMCDPECPNGAITFGAKIYEIDPLLCTECVGHYDKPTCKTVCPINCIITDPDNVEKEETLWEKFVMIQEATKSNPLISASKDSISDE